MQSLGAHLCFDSQYNGLLSLSNMNLPSACINRILLALPRDFRLYFVILSQAYLRAPSRMPHDCNSTPLGLKVSVSIHFSLTFWRSLSATVTRALNFQRDLPRSNWNKSCGICLAVRLPPPKVSLLITDFLEFGKVVVHHSPENAGLFKGTLPVCVPR